MIYLVDLYGDFGMHKPGVDDFKFTVLGEGLRVGRESGGVPAIVSGEFSSEVGRWLAGEWSQVFNTVGAVPRAAGGGGLGLAGGLPHGDSAFTEKVAGGGAELDGLAGE